MNLRKFWYLKMRNNVIREGKSKDEAFRWKFRRFSMEVETLSGNWKAKWMAAEHPYAYLLTGKSDENIEGFCRTMYEIGMLLTTDQGFVNDIQKAVKKYSQRLEKKAKVVEDEMEEKIAIESEKQVQEYVERKRK